MTTMRSNSYERRGFDSAPRPNRHQVSARPAVPVARAPDAAHRLVIGGICRDITYHVDELTVGRKHVMEGTPCDEIGGGAANNARVHRLLAPERRVVCLANLGDDEAGNQVRRAMAELDIELPLPLVAREATSVSHIVREQTGRGTIFGQLGARAVPVPLAAVASHLRGASACCLVAHSVSEQMAAILKLAYDQCVPRFVGLGTSQIALGYDAYAGAMEEGCGAEVVMLNEAESARLTGTTDLDRQLQLLRCHGRVQIAVITRGPDGISALNDQGVLHVPAYQTSRPILRDTGAGDAAQAALVDSLVRGRGLADSLQAAARNGFEACVQPSGSLARVAMDEYLEAMDHREAA